MIEALVDDTYKQEESTNKNKNGMEYKMYKFSPMKTIRRMAVCAVMTLACVSGYAQSKDFEKLAKINGVEYTHIDKEMIHLAAEKGEALPIGDNLAFAKAASEIVRVIDDIMVFSCEKKAAGEKLKKSVQKLMKGDIWETLIDLKGGNGKAVKISQAKADDQITNVIFVSEDDGVKLVVINGSLDIAQLMKLQNNNNDED